MEETAKNEEKARQLFKAASEFYFRGMSGPAAEDLEEIVRLSTVKGAIVPEEILRDSHRNLGLLYSLHYPNSHHSAVAHFREAVRLGTKKDYDLCRQFGLSLYLNNEYEQCIPWLNDALEITPDDNLARVFLGLAYVEVAERKSDFSRLIAAREQLSRLTGASGLREWLEYKIANYFPHNRLRL